MVVRGVGVGELYHDDDEEGEGGRGEEGGASARAGEQVWFGRDKGREVEEVPMCAHCVVQCEGDDEDAITQRASRRVERVDGGLGRKRWERGYGHGNGDGDVSMVAKGAVKRVPRVTEEQERRPPGQQQQSPPVSHGQTHRVQALPHEQYPPHGRIGPARQADGAESDVLDIDYHATDCVVPLDTTIYISIFDPFGEPAFRPRPTKPIPRWMQMLPHERSQHRRHEPRPHSVLDAHFRPPSTFSVRTTVCPTTPPETPTLISNLPPDSVASTPRLRRRKSCGSMSSHYSEFLESDANATPFNTLKGPSFVSEEPSKRPSSRLTQTLSHELHESSQGRSAIAVVARPPSRNDYVQSAVEHTRSPFHVPTRQPSPLIPPEAVPERRSPGPNAMWIQQNQMRNPSPAVAEPPDSDPNIHPEPLPRRLRRTPPAQSREFLNLYRGPTRPSAINITHTSADTRTNTASGPAYGNGSGGPANHHSTLPSAAVPGRFLRRAVGDGGRQVQGTLRRVQQRQQEPQQRSWEPGDDGALTVHGTIVRAGMQPARVPAPVPRKRASLQAELKRLFGGRGRGGE
ncbi:hypothetical protein F5Y15DRAFT_425339 [Xylariaceae sp. FL0016]|nr:hypothetical protein F5Y15DRAFT_425339 [Xylariaceae sp. FL0016]